jgi:ribosome-binding factor A
MRTISEIIREELHDPRIGIFSITDVELSGDLHYADVKVSAVGGEEATEALAKVLNSATPLIWNRLRDETDLRFIPKLRFHSDTSGEYLDEIERLLAQIHDTDNAAAPAGDSGAPPLGEEE